MINEEFEYIPYGLLESIEEEIARALRISRKTGGTPECILLSGRLGTGKTTLIKRVIARQPPRHTVDGDIRPIFYASIQAPISLKQTIMNMLEKSGDLAADRGTEAQLRFRLIRRLKYQKIDLVIIDDIHNLFDARDRLVEPVAHWLKSLIKELGVPFVIIGVEGKVERLLQENLELSRLFYIRQTLKPFAWPDETVKPEQASKVAEPFIRFLVRAWATIGISPDPQLAAPLLAQDLHYATGGVVGYLMSLLHHAAENARAGHRETITRADFSRAFDEHLATHLQDLYGREAIIVNPFAK